MPARTTPLITNQFYHTFNRGINKQPIFLGIRDYKRALEVLEFYSFTNPPVRFSKFLLLANQQRINLLANLRRERDKLVEIISFALMPNHFHFLLEQKKDNGISKFMANFQNSYTRFFNTKYHKIGPLLQGQFKTVRIEDENQLFHLNRYIHLNPYSSFVVKKIVDLNKYPWSSFQEYIEKSEIEICSKEIILSSFKNVKAYQQFVFDQADYQRELDKIKHLTLED